MIAETVNKNIHRLCHFLGMPEDTWPSFEELSPLMFLQRYAWVMDYNGCGPHGLGRIFLPPDDYKEMEEWLSSGHRAEIIYHHDAENRTIDNGGQMLPVVRPASIGLMFDGYHWHIQRIENQPHP